MKSNIFLSWFYKENVYLQKHSQRESNRPYKLPLAAARVVSRASAMLLDSAVLPFNVTYFIDYVEDAVQLSLKHLDEKIHNNELESRIGKLHNNLLLNIMFLCEVPGVTCCLLWVWNKVTFEYCKKTTAKRGQHFLLHFPICPRHYVDYTVPCCVWGGGALINFVLHVFSYSIHR